jgi:hypothetical protein
MIEEVQRWVTLNREFKSLQAAQDFRVDMLGDNMNKFMVNDLQLGPDQRIKLIAYLTLHRERIRYLLDY